MELYSGSLAKLEDFSLELQPQTPRIAPEISEQYTVSILLLEVYAEFKWNVVMMSRKMTRGTTINRTDLIKRRNQSSELGPNF